MKIIKTEIYKCSLCGAVKRNDSALDYKGCVDGVIRVDGYAFIHKCYKDKTKEGFDNKIGVMMLIGFEMED